MAGKIILITGANRGIGYSIVQALASRPAGHSIIVAAREKQKAVDAIDELQAAVGNATEMTRSLHPIKLDVSSDTDIEAAVHEIETRFGRLDGTQSAQDFTSNPL